MKCHSLCILLIKLLLLTVILILSPPIPLRLYTLPYWSNPNVKN